MMNMLLMFLMNEVIHTSSIIILSGRTQLAQLLVCIIWNVSTIGVHMAPSKPYKVKVW